MFIEKKFLLDQSHFDNVQAGLDIVYNLVSKTMGPAGSNVMISKDYFPPVITKDGATVADAIYCSQKDYSPIINLVKSVTQKAAKASGDGSSTTTVLTHALYKAFNSRKDDKLRILNVTKHLQELSKSVIEELKKLSKRIETKDELKNIILISTNHDIQMTEMLLECLDVKKDEDIKHALDKPILLANSKNEKDFIEKIYGSKFEAGVASVAFYNTKAMNKTVINDPMTLIIDGTVRNFFDLKIPLAYAKSENKPLIVFANEFSPEAINLFIQNRLNGLDITAVITPGYGGTHSENLISDLALLCGGKVVKENSEFELSSLTLENFQLLDNIIGKNVKKFEGDSLFYVIETNVDKEILQARIKELEDEIRDVQSTAKVDTVKRRIEKLRNGIVNLYISGNSDVERQERYYRAEDAIGAIRSAIEEGYVSGAGKTLYTISNMEFLTEASKSSFREKAIAAQCLMECLKAPIIKIYENAQIDIMKHKTILDSHIDKCVDINTEQEIFLKSSGVIDPTKVVRIALEYSISLASTLISSSASILTDMDSVIKNAKK